MKPRTLHNAIFATSLVSERNGSWKWQNAYRIATYGVRRTKDGRLVFYCLDRSHKIPSVGRDRRMPEVETDHQGTLHHRPIVLALDALRERLTRAIGSERGARAERLMRRLIPGIPE